MEFIKRSRMTLHDEEAYKKIIDVFYFMAEPADKQNTAESPRNLNNPVKSSRSHQELHRELLMAHRK